MLNAQAHVARTVCRRLERLLVRLANQEPVSAELLAYVNRLIEEHRAMQQNHNHVLWALINIAIWHNRFFLA